MSAIPASFASPEHSIARLPELVAALPPDLRALCEHLFFVERAWGQAVPPETMYEWVRRHFGEVDRVREQVIVRVANRVTLESASFNPLRASRPLDNDRTSDRSPDELLEEEIAASAGPHDTFHDPLRGTTADVFGRIHGEHCVSASNVAKYDGWHGLVIFNEFHPLRFTRAQLGDYFAVALRWFAAARHADPSARYPLITWNCLWKSGASITHGHIQTTLSRGMAWGEIEHRRRAAADYRARHGTTLSNEVWQAHEALGLALSFPTAPNIRGFVSLTPAKDREVVLLSEAPPTLEQLRATDNQQQPEFDAEALHASLTPLWEATYHALRNLIDRQGVRSFNLAVYFPPFAPTPEPWDNWPVCVRMLDRGNPLSRLVNFGAMELFASNIITADPFAVAAALRETLPTLREE